MKKWSTILIGTLFAGFVLFQLDQAQIGVNDITRFMDEKKIETKYAAQQSKNYYKADQFSKEQIDSDFVRADKFLKPKSFEENVVSAILPNENNSLIHLAEFFKKLQKIQTVERFIIISNSTGNGISLSEYGFDTPEGKIDADSEFIKSISGEISENNFKNETSLKNISPYIAKTFPQAKVVPILINKNVSDNDVAELATKLANFADDKTVVIGLNTFNEKMDKQKAMFNNEFIGNVFKSFDYEGLQNVPVNNKQILRTVLKYSDEKDAMKNFISRVSLMADSTAIYSVFSDGKKSSKREITILAFGDMMLGRHVRTLMDRNGKDYIFEKVSDPDGNFFKGADFVFANLEGPIKGTGFISETSMIFGFNEDVAPFLKKYGFNILSIANNHALNQGDSGRDTTITALDNAGIGWCGNPTSADTNSVYYKQIQEKKVAFLCFEDIAGELNKDEAVNLIASIRPNVDYLIVSIHWGNEYKHNPNKLQVDTGHRFVDAGADFIIGHHPHVVQSFENYNGKFIFYSLGNFVFDQYWSADTQKELAIGIVLGEKTKVYLFPMKSDNSRSYVLNGTERENWIKEFLGYTQYNEELQSQISDGLLIEP